MKRQELNDLSLADIETKLHDNLEDLQNLHFQKALQQLENPIR
ncbi:MAG: 50S ribosomal protein L29, partial [Candidatus Marinimicrobia bacterium]|nr:50S ribosomal protein L29 [Candidatus Neomarinimicrobiota bacterium]